LTDAVEKRRELKTPYLPHKMDENFEMTHDAERWDNNTDTKQTNKQTLLYVASDSL